MEGYIRVRCPEFLRYYRKKVSDVREVKALIAKDKNQARTSCNRNYVERSRGDDVPGFTLQLEKQLIDIFTKSLNDAQFKALRSSLGLCVNH